MQIHEEDGVFSTIDSRSDVRNERLAGSGDMMKPRWRR
ncbi:unnamed protein product [Brassica oleracea var. botrytis]